MTIFIRKHWPLILAVIGAFINWGYGHDWDTAWHPRDWFELAGTLFAVLWAGLLNGRPEWAKSFVGEPWSGKDRRSRLGEGK